MIPVKDMYRPILVAIFLLWVLPLLLGRLQVLQKPVLRLLVRPRVSRQVRLLLLLLLRVLEVCHR